MTPAHVTGLGLWTPGYKDLGSWIAGAHDPDVTRPDCTVLGPRGRRATSLTTLMGAEVIEQVAGAAGIDLSAAQVVFGSAYGEFQTAVAQMNMIDDDGKLSPARFKNSVHNTVTGLLSIATGNKGFGTALAAGPATFAMSVLEALALLESNGGVALVAVADEYPGQPFGAGPPYAPLGVGLCLSREPVKGKSLALLSQFERRTDGTSHPVEPELRGNPAAAGLALLRAVVSRRDDVVPLEPGDRPYCLKISFDTGIDS